MTVKAFSWSTFAAPFDAVWRATGDAIQAAGAKVKSSDPRAGRLTAQVALSFWSWGERVEVQLTRKGPSETTVSLESRSRFPLTLVDWGKNQRNVNAILQELQAILSTADARHRISRDLIDELKELAELREKGALTEEEFEKQKKVLLEGG